MKDAKLSVWNNTELQTQGATLSDLQIDSWAGSGQLFLTAQDYQDIALEVSMRLNKPLTLQVVMRPEDQYVKPPWRQWRSAHVQVELDTDGLKHFPQQFRTLAIQTAKLKKAIISPVQ